MHSVHSVAVNVCAPLSSPADINRWKLTIVSALAKDILSLVSILCQGKVVWEVGAGQGLMLGFHDKCASIHIYNPWSLWTCRSDEYVGLVAFIYCFDTFFYSVWE